MLLPFRAFAQPAVASVSGTPTHGAALLITGSGFGSKVPAAPLLWDDGEGSHALAERYTDFEPTAASADYNIQYRSGSFRGMGNPHGRGTRFIAGGHEDNRPYGVGVGNTVGLMKSFGQDAPLAYLSFYYALDSQWPTNAFQDAPTFSNNHKMTNYEPSGARTIYTNPYHYKIYARTGTVGGSVEYGYDKLSLIDNNESSSAQVHCNNDTDHCLPTASVRGGWVHWEELAEFNATLTVNVLDGSREYANSRHLSVPSIAFGNISAITLGGYFCFQTEVATLGPWSGPDANGEYSAALSRDVKLLNRDKANAGFLPRGSPGSLATGEWGYLGGRVYLKESPSGHVYYATDSACGSIGGASEHGGNADAFRYFDDVYVDTTFARVVIANSPNLDQATIIEPQIPTAWSAASITVKANLGRLGPGGLYLFVFDAANTHNATGYPLLQDPPPQPPARFRAP